MNKETYLTEYPKHESMRENVKKDKNRFHFHMMPPTGWMNDPNGLCEFQGVNHIYFQYTPFLAGWGRMINRTRLTTIYICKIRPVYKVPSLHLLRGKNYSRKKKQHKSQEKC